MLQTTRHSVSPLYQLIQQLRCTASISLNRYVHTKSKHSYKSNNNKSIHNKQSHGSKKLQLESTQVQYPAPTQQQVRLLFL